MGSVIILLQAEDGVGLPEEILEGETFERSLRIYFMYLRFDLLWSLNLLALVVLNFIEVSRRDYIQLYLF